jgi:hypothetical protein
MALAFRVSRRIELARPDVPPSARQRRQTGPIGPGLKLEAVSDHVGRSTGRGHGTLYDRLGGRDAITAVVDDLLARCAATTPARLTVPRRHEHTSSSNHDGDLGRVLNQAPDLAEKGRALFYRTGAGEALLATVRKTTRRAFTRSPNVIWPGSGEHRREGSVPW